MKNKNCIVVVNYFASEILSNVLDVSKKYKIDIVIVDNSCDEKERLVLEKDFKNIKIVFNENNVGFGAGCHIGIEEAKLHGKYDNFLFVNPDISDIDLSKIDEAIEAFCRDKRAAYFQPLILDNRGNNSILGIRETSDIKVVFLYTFIKKIFTSLEQYVLYARELNGNKTNLYIPSGAFFIVKAEVLETIGGFPRDTFLYFEEWLFAARVKKLGMYGYIDSSVSVHHEIGYSTGLQYGAGSAKMLRYRKEAFEIAVETIIKSKIASFGLKLIVKLDFYVRLAILNMKKVKK